MPARKPPYLGSVLATVIILASLGLLPPSAPAGAALSTWSVVPSPNTSANQPNSLSGVSCTSASACTAVGTYFTGTTNQTLIEQWDGTAWSIVSSPNTSTSQQNVLTAVSCTSGSACTAVGEYTSASFYDQTLIEQWNGTTWTIVSGADSSTSQQNQLYGVYCASASTCTAVGYYNTDTSVQTLVEQWDGVTWSVVSSPNTSISEVNQLYGVSCGSATSCTAVGDYYTGSNLSTLIEQWNGTSWSITSSPNTSDTEENLLKAISCPSASACFAVGHFDNGTSYQTLIEQWDGSAWSIVSSPDSGIETNDLYGVTCTSDSDCTAVGYYAQGAAYQTLIEQLTGSGWSIVSSPNTSLTEQNVLSAVSCTSSSACTSVGNYYTGGNTQTLVAALPGLPEVSAVSPTSGPGGPGTSVTISGTNLSGARAVHFGVKASPAVDVVSDTSITAVVPPEPPGTVDVTVDTPRGTSATSPADQFTYTQGYWEVASDGGLFTFGSVEFYGSMGGKPLNKPIVGVAATPDQLGYWEVASDGGLFSFGDAVFSGSTGAMNLNKPIVGMAANPNGNGYWEVASDGGIFSWGGATFYGSTGAMPLNKPIVGMAGTPDGGGYWEVASDGGIFSWGDAAFFGSTGAMALNEPIVGMATTPDGGGYWLVASDGGLFAYGDAAFFGSMGGQPLNQPIVGLLATPDGGGYWEVASDGGLFSFGDATFEGSMGGQPLNQPIVGMA